MSSSHIQSQVSHVVSFFPLCCVDQGMEMGGLSSRRVSAVGEQLTFETTSDPPPQRRKKKKKSAAIGEKNEKSVSQCGGRQLESAL